MPVSLSCLGWCSALRGPVQRAASVIAARCVGTCSALYLEGHRMGASPALRCVVPLAVQPFPVVRFLLPGEKPCPYPMCGLAKRCSALRWCRGALHGLADGHPTDALCHLCGNEILHLVVVALGAQEEMELIVGAVKVVIGVLALPILVSADVVPQEAHALHVGE